jgi:8-oxo-dGTP pyrophosphatase MutT (NUDIX family)
MRIVERDVVAALIFSKDGKLFQGKSDPDSGAAYIGCWRIPGGGIEEGEDSVAAVIREVRGEIGLDISSYPMIMVDDQGRGEAEKLLDTGERITAKMKFTVYKVELDQLASDVRLSLDSREFVEFQWNDLKDLRKMQLTPPSVELFKRLGYL